MTRNMDLLGIASLPINAFSRDAAGKIKPQGKGSSAPDTPDYIGAAKETAKGNLDLEKYRTEANRINQYTPWGSLTYTNDRQFDQNAYDAAMAAYNRQTQQQQQATQGPSGYYSSHGEGNQYIRDNKGGGSNVGSQLAPPNAEDFYTGGNSWSQNVELAPELQAQLEQQWKLMQGLFDPQDAALGRVQESLGSAFNPDLPNAGVALDPNALPGMGSVYDPNLATNNATELLMERLNPQLDRQREALRAQLANQGVTQGSPAYNEAMAQLDRAANDAYTQASLHGIGLGMQQQGMQYGQQQGLRMNEAGLQNQQFNQSNQARQQSLAEQAYMRGLPLQELQALMSGGQVQMPQFPGFAQQGQVPGVDYLGAANSQYGADLGKWNAQQAQTQGAMQGLGNIGGLVGNYFGGPAGGLLGGLGGTLLGGLFG